MNEKALLLAAICVLAKGVRAQPYSPAELKLPESVLDLGWSGDPDIVEVGHPGGGHHGGGGFVPRPQPHVPQPHVPQPHVPQPHLPQPRLPQRPPQRTPQQPPRTPSHTNPDRHRVAPPATGPVARPTRPNETRLQTPPTTAAHQHVVPTAPDNRARQQLAKMDRATHQAAVVGNAAFLQETVLGRRGWHERNGIHYYHHPQIYGLVGVCYGSAWFWIHYHNANWWWYHPHHQRWLVYRNAYWWYWDATLGWILWNEATDTFFIVQDDRLTPLPLPGQPPAARDDAFYSADGSLAALVTGASRQCHLYRSAQGGLRHVAFLGEGVSQVRFMTDQATGAVVVQVSFANGSVTLFNADGDFYGPPPVPDRRSAADRGFGAAPEELGARVSLMLEPGPETVAP
ncbi:MAG TPA: hypothetical protein VNI01_06375 [Elusimicrobiota bacterium]|nr:hypothetical protein [Elusimicrobiota bacterium]